MRKVKRIPLIQIQQNLQADRFLWIKKVPKNGIASFKPQICYPSLDDSFTRPALPVRQENRKQKTMETMGKHRITNAFHPRT